MKALRAGVPRRMVILTHDASSLPDPIDSSTGLPVAVVTVPAALALQQTAFAEAYNAEIDSALKSGESAVDFRPFLHKETVIARWFAHSALELSPTNPLDFPQAGVSYDIYTPKPPRIPPRFKPPAGARVRRTDPSVPHWA